jgi:hypothetical protein
MRLSRPAALLPLLMLAACYSSTEPLFSVADGRLPIAEGSYRNGTSGEVVKLVIYDGNHYHFTNKDGTSDVILVPLARQSDTYIVENISDDGTNYAVLKTGSGRFRMLTPDCSKQPDRDAASGLATNIDSDECSFADADRLATAVAKLARGDLPDRWEAYAPAGR